MTASVGLLEWMRSVQPVPRRRPEERTALVVQGGGVRGAFGNGVLRSFEDAGLSQAFDVMLGVSAGFLNLVYFAARQAKDCSSLYGDFAALGKLAKPWRLRSMLDLDTVVEEGMKRRFPVDIAELEANPSHMMAALTDARSGEAVYVDPKDRDLDLYEVVRAACAIPGLYNRAVQIRGTEYVDGGIAVNAPLSAAYGLGVQNIVVVLTRTDRGSGMRVRCCTRAIDAVALRGFDPTIRTTLARRRHAPDQQHRCDHPSDAASEGDRTGNIWIVRPSASDRDIALLDIRRRAVAAAEHAGYAAGLRTINGTS